jgi:hypothetical protein
MSQSLIPHPGSGNVGRDARSTVDHAVGSLVMQSAASTVNAASSSVQTAVGGVVLRSCKRMRSLTNSSQDDQHGGRPTLMRPERPLYGLGARHSYQPFRGNKQLHASPCVKLPPPSEADDDLLSIITAKKTVEHSEHRSCHCHHSSHNDTQVPPSHTPSIDEKLHSITNSAPAHELPTAAAVIRSAQMRELRSAWTQTRSLMLPFALQDTSSALQFSNESDVAPPLKPSATLHQAGHDASSQTDVFANLRTDLSELIFTLQAFLSIT